MEPSLDGIDRHVSAHRGRQRRGPGPGILATFEAPGQAIRCAAAIRQESRAADIPVRAGIHTGEVDLIGAEVGGTAVEIATSIARLAGPAEILVSRTVKDLVVGSGIALTERGAHALVEGSEPWPVYAVAESPRP